MSKTSDTVKAAEINEALNVRELSPEELDTVTGGSFDLGNIVGSVAKAVLPMAL